MGEPLFARGDKERKGELLSARGDKERKQIESFHFHPVIIISTCRAGFMDCFVAPTSYFCLAEYSGSSGVFHNLNEKQRWRTETLFARNPLVESRG